MISRGDKDGSGEEESQEGECCGVEDAEEGYMGMLLEGEFGLKMHGKDEASMAVPPRDEDAI